MQSSAPHSRWVLPAAVSRSLGEQLPAGRLIELSTLSTRALSEGSLASAQMTAAVSCVRHAQARGETTAWVQAEGGSLYPPDLHENGVDLAALIVVHVPKHAGAHGLGKAAELLLRSGGFGLVVIDLVGMDALPSGSLGMHRLQASSASSLHKSQVSARRTGMRSSLRGDIAFQGRLLGLAREHASTIVLLTESTHGSFGPLVSVCIEPRRVRVGRGRFEVEPSVRKDKSGLLASVANEERRGPWGLL